MPTKTAKATKKTTKPAKTTAHTSAEKDVAPTDSKRKFAPKLKLRRKDRKQAKQPKPTYRKLTGSFRLFRDSMSLVWQHWKLFAGITLVYIVLSLTLIGGLGGGLDIQGLREDLGSELGNFGSSITLFGVLVGSVGSTTSEQGAAYQTVVVVIISLAVIWALRQLMAGEKIGLRDVFYKGMYPLVPFVLVLLVMGVQLIPLMVAGFLYSAVFVGGLAVGAIEMLLWMVPIVLLIAWSVRMTAASLFALYIVTLPDMRPLAALRSAKKLVHYRRLAIIRKLLALLVILVVLGALITIPLIMLVPFLVVWVFVVLSMLGLIVAHTYIYNLYRELL